MIFDIRNITTTRILETNLKYQRHQLRLDKAKLKKRRTKMKCFKNNETIVYIYVEKKNTNKNYERMYVLAKTI